ncbi:hypothetical protein BC939DRAFT_532416 [Gamsiella multidivaricata]|uniref:uncharacterized protein n=1 Tax=Gamsiella multidivaricata TaxID=101098 RepID=UPI00221E51C9|nr:uncharacterized protein BC939DRAFT_532416 [Gamsiella multidivaricata]KAI7817843.1 hypothetical protein BC939DRAFT_532416 [Gamsiella multidivaricata]
MPYLTRKDNDLLRKQEWQLLSGPGNKASGITSTTTAHVLSSFPNDDQEDDDRDDNSLFLKEYGQDTFLVKSYFSETEKSYVILVTNFKQCWCEKLQIEGIRERCKEIRSFAYEEDSQLEALLLSLSAIFATENLDAAKTPGSSAASSQPQLAMRNRTLVLMVGFKFGLASVQWNFKLRPMIQATGLHHPIFTSSLEPDLSDEELSLETMSKSKRKTRQKRSRNFLEDSDNEDNNSRSESDNEDKSDDGNESSSSRQKARIPVDGMSVLFDHLVLPLISLTNAYRKQAKDLEGIIKSKEHEVVEALEMLEQSGVAYHHRRKATERYDRARTEMRLNKDVEQLVKPQMFGPRELFSEDRIPALCSIVSKNAGDQDIPISSFEQKGELPSASLTQQVQASSSQGARGSATASILKDSASVPTAGDESRNAEGTNVKSSKEAEEMERRRALQEQLDKEKAEKEKARKKKKLF